jgi:hypothetical protein
LAIWFLAKGEVRQQGTENFLSDIALTLLFIAFVGDPMCVQGCCWVDLDGGGFRNSVVPPCERDRARGYFAYLVEDFKRRMGGSCDQVRPYIQRSDTDSVLNLLVGRATKEVVGVTLKFVASPMRP